MRVHSRGVPGRALKRAEVEVEAGVEVEVEAGVEVEVEARVEAEGVGAAALNRAGAVFVAATSEEQSSRVDLRRFEGRGEERRPRRGPARQPSWQDGRAIADSVQSFVRACVRPCVRRRPPRCGPFDLQRDQGSRWAVLPVVEEDEGVRDAVWDTRTRARRRTHERRDDRAHTKSEHR